MDDSDHTLTKFYITRLVTDSIKKMFGPRPTLNLAQNVLIYLIFIAQNPNEYQQQLKWFLTLIKKKKISLIFVFLAFVILYEIMYMTLFIVFI